MKTSLLFIPAFFCIALSTNAQGPTLTSANSTFTIGEQFFSRFAKVDGIKDLNGGANQTWDYRNIIDSNATVGVEVVTPASTPFASSFPSSNLAIKALNDSVYVFYNSQTSALNESGIATIDSSTITYTKGKIYLPYPFSYGSNYDDSVVEIIKANSSLQESVLLRGKDSLSGDGYGTLIIPGLSGSQTFNNVLRVKYIENTTYSKDTLGATTILNNRSIGYIYLTPGTHAPLFSNITTTTRTTFIVLGVPFFDTATTSKVVSYLQLAVLPLSFTSFNASLNNNIVDLKWQTAQEINTSHFNVQRSLSNTDFKDIAELKASGNSIISNYNYSDEDFVKTSVPPTVYYRIKETDKDGKEFYSETRIVHGNGGTISLYPNPATSYINFKGAGIADAISIYDAKGNLVKQLNNYQLSKPLNIANFSKGNYFIKIKIANEITNTTFIKQ